MPVIKGYIGNSHPSNSTVNFGDYILPSIAGIIYVISNGEVNNLLNMIIKKKPYKVKRERQHRPSWKAKVGSGGMEA
jgi:hypothetical protein